MIDQTSTLISSAGFPCPKCKTLGIIEDDKLRCHCGFTSDIIDCACGCGQKRLDKGKDGRPRRFIKYHHLITSEWKNQMSVSRLGNKSPSWKGDDVGIGPLHKWINENMPKPESGLCQICNQKPLYDAINTTGIYNRDFKNWQYACRSCHLRFDYHAGIRTPVIHTEATKRKIGLVNSSKQLGTKYTAERTFRTMLAQESRKYAKTISMSGRFRIPSQEWIKRACLKKKDPGVCLACGDTRVVKYGFQRGRQVVRCKTCGRHFLQESGAEEK